MQFIKLDDQNFEELKCQKKSDCNEQVDKSWINKQNSHKIDNELGKKILCTAGSNYFVAKRDGKIYRCFHDLNPLGDISDFKSIVRKKATPCRVGYICDSSGDQMFSTQWNHENSKKNNFYEHNPVCTDWKDSDPNNLNLSHAYVIIYPTEGCNFSCPYCCNYYPADENDKRPVLPGERTLEDWIQFFETLHAEIDNVQININGGEPLLRHDIHLIIKKMMDLDFKSSIVTNFSITNRLDKILKLNHKNRKKFSFSITLHPVNKNYNFEKILEYIIKFKEHGYPLRCTILGWKDNISHYEKYKSVFSDLGIPYWLKWCGGYDHPPEFVQYLYDEGACRPTPEYLRSINWEDFS